MAARRKGIGASYGSELRDLQLLATLQHQGAGTGLLDFTYSPLVGLFFAVREQATTGKVYILDVTPTASDLEFNRRALATSIEEILMEPPTIPKLLTWEPAPVGDSAARIVAQRSLFVMDQLSDIDSRLLLQIEIPRFAKRQLLRELEMVGITYDILFGDLQGFSSSHSPTSPLPPDARSHREAGNELLNQQSYESALGEYDQYLAFYPNDGEILFQRGNALAELRRDTEAVHDYDSALSASSPRMVRAIRHLILFNRANVKARGGFHNSAIEDYTEAISIFPELDQAYFNRGNVYFESGRFDLATEDYMNASSTPSARYNLGNAQMATGRFADALISYTEAIAAGLKNEHTRRNASAARTLADTVGNRGVVVSQQGDLHEHTLIVTARIQGDEPQAIPKWFAIDGNTGSIGNFGHGSPGGAGFEGGPWFRVLLI